MCSWSGTFPNPQPAVTRQSMTFVTNANVCPLLVDRAICWVLLQLPLPGHVAVLLPIIAQSKLVLLPNASDESPPVHVPGAPPPNGNVVPLLLDDSKVHCWATTIFWPFVDTLISGSLKICRLMRPSRLLHRAAARRTGGTHPWRARPTGSSPFAS